MSRTHAETEPVAWGGGGGRWAILVHGGAGAIEPAGEGAHAEGCRRAVEEGRRLLDSGASALDAVQRAVEVLEEDSIFNAGFGGALNSDGELELDASIMEGRSLRAGAVCALKGFLHPVAIARAALEDGRHVLYAADGAARFALEHGFAPVPPSELITEEALRRLSAASAKGAEEGGGTVGAVAIGVDGVVAAATSTGGTTAKRPGRVGDSPLLGAGTYADALGGASATGHGEGILRVLLCHRAVSALSSGCEPLEAASQVIATLRARVGSTGGIILVDGMGRLGWARSTSHMAWAAAWDGAPTVDGV